MKIYYTLANGETIQVDVSPEVAEILRKSQLKELALQKQDKRHLAMLGFTEGISENYLHLQAEDVANTVIRRESNRQLREAISLLPPIQRRRIIARYFEGLSIQSIANIEGVSHQSISASIKAALVNLQKILYAPCETLCNCPNK